MDVIEGLLSPPEDTDDRETAEAPDETSEATDEPDAPDDGDSEPEPDAEVTGEDDAEEPQAPQTYKVKVDGQDVEVTLDELQRGYSRTSDYTRKTMALADQRKALETEATQAREQRERYGNLLQQLESAMTANMPKEPDWDKIRKESPDEFPTLAAEWSIYKERLAAVKAEQERVSQAEAQDRARQFQATIQAEQDRLFDALPEWRDEGKRQAGQASLVAYAKHQGFTPQEIAGIYDHRAVVLLRKAMLYDQLQAKKPEARTKIEKIKTATPGTGVKKPPSEAKRALDKLAKSHSIDDAAAVFLHGISDKQ